MPVLAGAMDTRAGGISDLIGLLLVVVMLGLGLGHGVFVCASALVMVFVIVLVVCAAGLSAPGSSPEDGPASMSPGIPGSGVGGTIWTTEEEEDGSVDIVLGGPMGGIATSAHAP